MIFIINPDSQEAKELKDVEITLNKNEVTIRIWNPFTESWWSCALTNENPHREDYINW